MPAGRVRNNHAQSALAAAALLALHSGKARSKTHAAELTGASRDALKPANLSALAARNRALAPLLRTNALEITAEIKGEGASKRRVSMREALSEGATRAVGIMAELAPRIGELTREEERKYAQCARWLQMCRHIGLFGENEGATLPGELRHEPEPEQTDEPEPGSLEYWQEQDDLTARMLTVEPDPGAKTLEA